MIHILVHTLLQRLMSILTLVNLQKIEMKGFGCNLLTRFLASVNSSLQDFHETFPQPHVRLPRPIGTNAPRAALSH